MKKLKGRPESGAVEAGGVLVVASAPDEQKLIKYVKAVKHLPPAPKVIVELLPLFSQPDRDVDRIVKLLCHEPSFTAEILKACNTAFFSGGAPCTDMFEAIMRLGLFEVFRIVIAVAGSHTVSAANAATGLNVQKMWRHSVVCAVAASVIAGRRETCDASAFTAGLLHDVGRLVFASAEGSKYSQMLFAGERFQKPVVELEQAAYGFDHAMLGAYLLGQWSLPPDVVGGVRYHHNIGAAGEHRLFAATLHLANSISHAIDDLFSDPKTSLGQGTESSWVLGIQPKDVLDILAETKKGLEQVKDLLAI